MAGSSAQDGMSPPAEEAQRPSLFAVPDDRDILRRCDVEAGSSGTSGSSKCSAMVLGLVL